MRRMIWILAVSLLWSWGFGITIEAGDYGYIDGKIRNYSEGPWNSADTDLSEGTNKAWSFSMPSAGYVNNTFHSVQNVSAFPGADMSAAYDQYTLDYYSSGTMYYQNTGSDILNIGYTGYPNLVWNPPVPMGLPHFLGKTWNGTHGWAYGTYTISGKVLSEGQISTLLGSFPAVLVRYYYQTNAISYYNYQWETKEYGIIAYANTLNNGMLYVLNQADLNVSAEDQVAEIPSLKARVWPNPFAAELCLNVESRHAKALNISIYDLKGRLIHRSVHSPKPGTELSLEFSKAFEGKAAGIYFIAIKSGNDTLIRKISKLP